MKITFIDPPSGWKYGFPKILPTGTLNVRAWLVENGYPQKEIDALDGYFHVHKWEKDLKDLTSKELKEVLKKIEIV